MISEEQYKVILIGLDGATWSIIRKGVKQGILKGFKKLIESGVTAKLRSTIPPISPSAWTSIFTGVNPGKHGIFGFVKEDSQHMLSPISSEDRMRDPIWKIVSSYGKRVIAINIPFSYPPDRVNGIMGSGLGTPSINSNFIYPESWKSRILKMFPKYDVDFDEELLANTPSKLLEKIKSVTEEEIRLLKYLLNNEEYHLFIFVFRALDVVQHFFWHRYDIVMKYYKIFDELLEYLVDYVNSREHYILFICSDHGFNELHTLVYVNNWLESLGLLKTKKSSIRAKNKRLHVISAEKLQQMLLRLHLKGLTENLKRKPRLLRLLTKVIPSERFHYIHTIDWTQTKAYFSEATYGVHLINIKSRQEYEQIKEYIIKEAKNPRNLLNSAIKRVYEVREIYQGEYLQRAPDIIFLKKRGYRLVGGYNTEGSLFVRSSRETGDHNEEDGIFMALGKDLRKGYCIEGYIDLYDILPTILHILNIPIPSYIDGKVLKEIFCKESILSKREPYYIEYYEDPRKRLRRKIRSLRQKILSNR